MSTPSGPSPLLPSSSSAGVKEFHIYNGHLIVAFTKAEGYSIFQMQPSPRVCIGHAPTVTKAMEIIDIPPESEEESDDAS